jgi:hypothetical protein
MSANVTRNQLLNNIVKCTIATSSYISLPNVVCNPAVGDILSISGWFYPTTINSLNGGYLGLFSNRDESLGYKGLSLGYDKVNSVFYCQFYCLFRTHINYVKFTYPQGSQILRLHNFVFTKTGIGGNTYSFYIDGILLTPTIVTNTLVSGDTTTTTKIITLNAFNNPGNTFPYQSDCFFSNYQFYNKALTQTEVTALNRFPLIIPSTAIGNLTAQYKFTESNGLNIVDNIGANNGTIVGYTAAQTGNPTQANNIVWYDQANVPSGGAIIV